MRATASNDVMVDGHVVPDAAVALRRPQGQWHPLFHIIAMIAIPLIYAAYLGVAEEARDIAVGMAKRRRSSEALIDMVGRMETELDGARLAYEAMVAAHRKGPSPETTSRTMIARSLFVRHALATADLAMEVAGGAGFYREHGLERRFRDIQGARYHPMQAPQQQAFAGRLALGLDIARTF
jgi:alkylation response protein AidB-like acyl-CoA dehydrogenase